MILSFITNDKAQALAGEAAGIDRVLIDLERMGKAERQSGRGLFLSGHDISDVRRMKQALARSQIMVRIDPLHAGSSHQIDQVIRDGAAVVMLPWFHRVDQAKEFLDLLAGRAAAAALLVETPQAADSLPALCRLPGVAEVHVGLNDLSLALNSPFLFDVVADGTMDPICATLREFGVPFGFGGIGSLTRNDLPVPPDWVLAEQVLQGATRGWLSRTFRDLPSEEIRREVGVLRRRIEFWKSASPREQAEVRTRLRMQIRSAAAAV